MADGAVLIPHTDAAPMPRVEVLFENLDDATSVTVYRLAAGREYVMRGGSHASTAGGLTRIDMEAPFGVPSTYRAEMFDSSGLSLGYTPAADVTLTSVDSWVHNPLDPTNGVRVQFEPQAAGKLSRPVDATSYQPQGRRIGVVISRGRGGLKGVTLDCFTQSFEDADRFTNLVGDYSNRNTVPVLCFRLGSRVQRMRIPKPFFASVLDPREIEDNNHQGGEVVRFAVEGDEASPPSPGLFVPLLTRADLDAYYATRDIMDADNLTRLSLDSRYDLAGTA